MRGIMNFSNFIIHLINAFLFCSCYIMLKKRKERHSILRRQYCHIWVVEFSTMKILLNFQVVDCLVRMRQFSIMYPFLSALLIVFIAKHSGHSFGRIMIKTIYMLQHKKLKSTLCRSYFRKLSVDWNQRAPLSLQANSQGQAQFCNSPLTCILKIYLRYS